MTLFCDVALAARIERAEAELIAAAGAAAQRRRPDAAGFVIPIAGGVAGSAEDGSPFNKVAGWASTGCPARTRSSRSSRPSRLGARRYRSSSRISAIPHPVSR